MITVVIADDHRIVSDGLKKVLDAEPDIKCVGTATNGQEAIDVIRTLNPDVAIIDINMPVIDGIETTRRIKKEIPNLAVLILTAYDYEKYIKACLDAGASGYILKTKIPAGSLAHAIRMVHTGTGSFDLGSVLPIIKLAATKARTKSPSGCEISEREIAVLRLAATGITSKQIATSLSISELTVNSYFANIFRKLGVQSRIEAVVLAMKKGWIPDVNSASNAN